MNVFREVSKPTNGVLKKRITESNLALISNITGRIVITGAKVWTPQETFKIMGGARGKVFVQPQEQKSFTREIAPELLGMQWVLANSLSGADFEMARVIVEAFKREAIQK